MSLLADYKKLWISKLLVTLLISAAVSSTGSLAHAGDCDRVMQEAQEAFDKFFSNNRHFRVRSNSGNVYAGQFNRQDDRYVYFTDAITGRESALDKTRLNFDSLQGRHFSGENVTFKVKSKSGNEYSGILVAETPEAIVFRDPRMPTVDKILFKNRIDMSSIREVSPGGYVDGEFLKFRSAGGNIYTGKFAYETDGRIFLTDEHGNIFGLDKERLAEQLGPESGSRPRWHAEFGNKPKNPQAGGGQAPPKAPEGPNPFPQVPSMPRAGASEVQWIEWSRNALGVKPGATKAEIQAAHRKFLQYHPDRHGGDPRATELLKRVNMARDVLLMKLAPP